MRELAFKNLAIDSTSIRVQAEYEESIELSFEFDRGVEVSSTQVAIALATLAGTKFENVSYDFEVDREAIRHIEISTGADIEAVSVDETPAVTSSEGNILSFSGGYDSLCARNLMPKDTHLVSMDFGGWFARETDFFRSFDTLIVRTNLRAVPSQSTSLARNHWTFMAIGSILTARYFNARYHTFGQILGESLARTPTKNSTPQVLSAVGFVDAGYARGLTEVGTASVILQSEPALVKDSLKSLSGPADRKIFRKTALTQLAGSRLGIPVTVSDTDPRKSPQIAFGDDYASTLAALYCISRGRLDLISPLFSEIPAGAVKLASRCTMNFMEKVNWDAYTNFPEALREPLGNKLLNYGFEPYSERDWEEVKEIRSYLSEAYRLAH